MLQGKCLLCFTVNRQTFDIINTHLQQVLEKIVDFKIEAESLCLCFICHKRMQQCYKLMQLAKTSQCYLNNKLTEKINVSLKEHLPLLELTTSKMMNISFSKFESHIETDVKVKKEYLVVDGIEQQENFDERLECTQAVSDDPLNDISSEHDDLNNAPTWIKTEVEGVSIDYGGLGEMKRENNEQLTSVHKETSLKVDYRPEFTNIMIEPYTKNVNDIISNTLYPLKVDSCVPEKVYMCKFCPYVTKQNPHMLRHQRKHTGEKPFSCNICERKFVSKHNLWEHRRNHCGKPYACEICDQSFTRKCYLYDHRKTHSDAKPFTCDICQRNFSHKCYLRMHMVVHNNEKAFTCDVCDKIFSKKNYLKEHKRTHTGVKQCDICQKKFSQKSALNRHKKSHTEDKPYVCEICEKGFIRKCYLYDHRKTHSDAKPFICDICQRNFSHKQYLRRHMVVHTNEKPFTCNVCDKKFSKTYYLKVHKRTHTGVKPYTCDKCEREFSQKSALNKHKKNYNCI